ncbi:hypothetical protein G5B46_15500 [Caulobacter sp. 602-2]|uniref:Uncharacterized protein n=1 Tax=Caulobacter sp. 602-2 TaxID=2710887 RepID=A0A6G4QZD1_9CAUL|nr:hypothetical protein [Caulobacter sp. 602-2]NGM51016.1 hypothetical protein [Caulobacter sp. 602-2]
MGRAGATGQIIASGLLLLLAIFYLPLSMSLGLDRTLYQILLIGFGLAFLVFFKGWRRWPVGVCCLAAVAIGVHGTIVTPVMPY